MAPHLKVEQVGDQWLITSPDIPGLYVAHKDRDAAERAVPDAIAMLKRMETRQAAKTEMQKRTVKRVA